MTVWFTSDLHFGHANIIRYSKRPFQNVQEMNASLISAWNDRVLPGDIVYCLGDFALCSAGQATGFAAGLNGEKHLIFGNHDKGLRKQAGFRACWASTSDYKEIVDEEGRKIVLTHYPMLTWNGSNRGSWNLHGHCHGSLLSSLPANNHPARRLDVGADVWGYGPVMWSVLRDTMARRGGETVDHHSPSHPRKPS